MCVSILRDHHISYFQTSQIQNNDIKLDPGIDLRIAAASLNFYELPINYTQSLGDNGCYVQMYIHNVCVCCVYETVSVCYLHYNLILTPKWFCFSLFCPVWSEVACHHSVMLIYVNGGIYQYKTSVVISMILTEYDYYDCYYYMSTITILLLLLWWSEVYYEPLCFFVCVNIQ